MCSLLRESNHDANDCVCNHPNDAVDQTGEPGTVLCCWQIGDGLQQQSGWTVAEKQSRNDGKEEMALVLPVVASNGSHNRFPSQQRASIVNLSNKSMLPDNKNLSFQYICVFYEDTCIHIMYIIYMYVFYETLWPIQKIHVSRWKKLCTKGITTFWKHHQ